MNEARNSNFEFAPGAGSTICEGLKRLTENIRKDQPRTHCIRCGECCLRSSPTLQAEDLDLVEERSLQKKHLVTFRKGEFVTDPVSGTVGPAVREYIKIKEKKGTERGCISYDDVSKGCTIYDHRPLQCRALACWNTREILEVLDRPKLRRQDVVHDGVLMGLIDEHETRCSYAVLDDYVRSIPREGNNAVERMIGLLKFDHHLRPFVSEKLNIALDEMDFYFGRPLVDTIGAYGLRVIRDRDGGFFLTRIKKQRVME